MDLGLPLDPRLGPEHSGVEQAFPSVATPVVPTDGRHRPEQQHHQQERLLQQKRHHDADYDDEYDEEEDDDEDEDNDAAQQQQPQQSPHEHGPSADGVDAKKARACEACRGLKVRCEPDPNDEEGPCKRCRKAGRNCVVTAPTRKRQKKTDSRVSELEKKIDALTASLQARASQLPSLPPLAKPPLQSTNTTRPTGQAFHSLMGHVDAVRSWGNTGTPSPSQPPPQPLPASQSHSHSHSQPQSVAGQKRKVSEQEQLDGPGDIDDAVHSHGHGHGKPSSPRLASQPRPPPTLASASHSDDGDIVDRGLLTLEKAAELFSRYKDSMTRHLPAVVFSPSMTVMDLRMTKPYLFLAVMAAASSEMHDLQRVLTKELMQLLAYKIVVAGEKNLELVQTLHVAVIWYWPPEHFEELKFYQLVHMAAVMALDIGLGRKAPPRRGIHALSWREHQFKRLPQADPTSLECRRTWLTCHFLATNTSISLQRPNLVRWSSFMTESLELLASSPDAAPTDKYLCHLVWTHRMAEEIGGQFSMDEDPSAPVNLSDARTRFTLRALERDLEKYRDAVPRELMQPSLKLSFYLLSLYMHELVLHTGTTADQFRSPFSTEIIKDGMISSEPLSAAHINALSACLSAADGIFDTFLSMDVSNIRCLPVFNFVRVAYAIVILMKMYFSASSPGSELGKVIPKTNMRVEHYLNALLDKFRTTAADDKCRPAAKFLIVLAMLRSWFLKQNKAERRGVNPPAVAAEGSSAVHARHGANTPLQVLSEVAMGRDPTDRQRRTSRNSMAGMRQPPQPFFHDSIASSGSTPPTSTHVASTSASSTGTANDHTSGAVDPSLPANAVVPPSYPITQPQWMNPQQQPIPGPDMMGFAAGLLPGFDLESLGVTLDSRDMLLEDGAKMILNEPWFTAAFQGLSDADFFPF
ncbi:Fungal specific transcription factor [Drechmeria coniospora]|uniref:Fungal specific transcription factor n=1 Tax=Drechmeria coniospora TaxID=98403 RepID=A0A151GEP7_DRECN|nr:Fungal specific transcription factor [Drechmeria coniospora]KYK55553.1 Fungal specific transcription factor [Drechmeria coniospora]